MAATADFRRLKLVLSENTPNRLNHATNFSRPNSFGSNKIEFQFNRRIYLSTDKLGVLHQKRRRMLGVCCQATGTGVQPNRARAPSEADPVYAASAGKDRLLKVHNSILGIVLLITTSVDCIPCPKMSSV